MAANTERDAFGRLPEELRIKIMKPYIGGMSTYGTPVLWVSVRAVAALQVHESCTFSSTASR
jgi:hypothetical protein